MILGIYFCIRLLNFVVLLHYSNKGHYTLNFPLNCGIFVKIVLNKFIVKIYANSHYIIFLFFRHGVLEEHCCDNHEERNSTCVGRHTCTLFTLHVTLKINKLNKCRSIFCSYVGSGNVKSQNKHILEMHGMVPS